MNNLVFFLFGGVLLLLVSCENSSTGKEVSGADDSAGSTTYTARDGHTIGINVSLNDGAKWEANLETTRGIGIMQGLLGEFPGNATEEDYRALHNKLSTGFQSILQKCTMTGEAHNQLHNYLMPLKAMIDKLGTENLLHCQKTFAEMQGYLMKYSHFFYS